MLQKAHPHALQQPVVSGVTPPSCCNMSWDTSGPLEALAAAQAAGGDGQRAGATVVEQQPHMAARGEPGLWA